MSLTRFASPLLVAFSIAGAVPATAAVGTEGAPSRAARPPSHTAPGAPASSGFDPARAWDDLGCGACHGDDGPYRDKIKGALGKPVDRVARWIRNAPSVKPDTDMPSFEALINEPDSVALASWVLRRAASL
jgi:mono/diheme cytochrome c family protein